MREEAPDHQGRHQREAQGRDQAPDPSEVEVRKREPRFFDLPADQPGDQETADDEEHVDADVSTRCPRELGMIQNDREHGESSKTIDVGSVSLAGHQKNPSR